MYQIENFCQTSFHLKTLLITIFAPVSPLSVTAPVTLAGA